MNTHVNQSSIPTRRQFVGGLATGLVAAAAAPALGQERKKGDGTGEAPGQSVKQNPLEQYPKPPFKKQLQEWPGLTSKMEPRPDHGEKSYQGSGRLVGRKALISGGDSGIGFAVAIAYAREGADVAISYLPVEESDAKEVIELDRIYLAAIKVGSNEIKVRSAADEVPELKTAKIAQDIFSGITHTIQNGSIELIVPAFLSHCLLLK